MAERRAQSSQYHISLSRQILRRLASLRLAVFVLLLLGVITAVGTVVESRWDAHEAQKTVYHSVWMHAALILLIINLTAVMVDRWPWKKRHTGFVLAHIGIITLIIGATLTYYTGLDGSLILPVGGSQRYVLVEEPVLQLFQKRSENDYEFLHEELLDQIKDVRSIYFNGIQVIDYLPYALAESHFEADTHAAAQAAQATQASEASVAVRFLLQNENVHMVDWLFQRQKDKELVQTLGPAQVILFPHSLRLGLSLDDQDLQRAKPYLQPGKKALLLWPLHDQKTLQYAIWNGKNENINKINTGRIQAGEQFQTGWMGLTFHLLKYLPAARQVWTYHPAERPTTQTTSAILVKYKDKREDREKQEWLGLHHNLQWEDLVLSYTQRRIDLARRLNDLDFNMKLVRFEMDHYPGTQRASAYRSLVEVPGHGEHWISMNEPLQYKGLTFYQASFETDPNTGLAMTSVLSVNQDPGRWIKYLGSLLIVFGCIHMFYLKTKLRWRKTIGAENA